jgi:hypothetical protein
MTRRMETVQAIEVYIGERGYICLKQDDALGDTEDIVAMLPQQVPTIVRWLQECAAEVEARQRAEVQGPRLVEPPSGARVAPAAQDASVNR